VSLVNSSSGRTTRTADRESSAGPGGGLGGSSTESLTVEVRTEGIHHVLTVTGELDLATAPELGEVTRGLLDVASHIVIDLDQVGFIDSTGLSVLVATYRRVTSQGGSMVLVCNSTPCMRVMEMTGLSRVFTFCASTADAVGAGGCASDTLGQER
jgi:anti-sigma B factor antagonist